MKNGFIEFLDKLGLVWNFALNGLIGGIVWSVYKKSSLWESARQIIVGTFVAGYLSPFIKAKTAMSEQLMGGTSFVIGMMGMIIIDSGYKHILKLIKKWKAATVVVIKSGKD